MKLQQSIQRSSKSDGGIVGQTRNLAITVEWQLIFHEILLVSNNFREIMNDVSMNHSESARVHHELTGTKADQLHKNVQILVDLLEIGAILTALRPQASSCTTSSPSS